MDELITVGKEKDVSIGSAALTMAIGILVDRIGRLTPDDREELFELAKGLGAATCDEDVEAIRVAMREILDQSRGGVQAANLDDVVRPDKLKRRTDFVSARVAWLRAKSGMTQVEFGKKTGLPQSHISRIESGKLSPSRATLEKLATAFGVSLNQLDPSAYIGQSPIGFGIPKIWRRWWRKRN